jgi:neurofibromin 1
MNGDSSLVVTLVDRLTTRARFPRLLKPSNANALHIQLPHRTGSPLNDFNRDEIVVLTRATLVGVSASCIGIVVETLVQLLEDLAKPYKGVQSHPIHVLHSEIHVVELLAECCSTHWASVNTSRLGKGRHHVQSSDSESSGSEDSSKKTVAPDAHYGQKRRASRNKLLARNTAPEPLTDDVVKRLIDAIKLFSRPVSESYVLPASNILDDAFKGIPGGDRLGLESTTSVSGHLNGADVSKLLLDKSEALEAYTRGILEYVSCSNWARVLDYLKSSLQQAAHQPAGSLAQSNVVTDDDRSALITLRLISSFWVDSRKLSVVIQELCGSFLHLRKAFQTTVAIVLPLLITRWLERNPEEFIDLHSLHKRLDGGAETLFDMTNTMFDGGRRKALLFPFQTSLLFLLPDVFEVASNMRDVKSSSISKKVSFLEMLRKSLRNRNETAIYCLTSVLRAARHFPLDSDAALLSFALDVQEEVREAVFRRYTPGMDTSNIDSALMTAAFVSLAHLNFEACVESLAPLCLAPSAPQDFKIAVISSCSHFARQSNAGEYQPLFSKVAEFVRAQLKVCLESPTGILLTLNRPLLQSGGTPTLMNNLHSLSHFRWPAPQT